MIITAAIDWLKSAMDDSGGKWVMTSPFISPEICELIVQGLSKSEATCVIYTKLDPSAVASGFLSVRGMRSLIDAGVEVRHVDRLHAKCFAIGDNALVGSANLTGAGLGSSASANRGIGVELNLDETTTLRKEISNWPSIMVTPRDLDVLDKQAKNLTVDQKDSTIDLENYSQLQLAETLLADARASGRGLWVKLEYGDPKIDGWQQESWFASPKKGRPSFKVGDLVFICAKETKDCYAVVEITTEAEKQPDDYIMWAETQDEGVAERWPWINRTVPRWVPDQLVELKLEEIGAKGQALQNGHVRLSFDQFTMGVRALARLGNSLNRG
ncbi:hypothetical protein [Glutamicibacter arilaitensis]|uniref:hypothetical protein n=1 Tax=Glutamicibacter arilaitensis TaxID=256701 RepID=UPI003F8F0CD5